MGAGFGEFETKLEEVEVIDSKGLPMPPKWSDKWKPMILDRDKDGTWFMIVTLTFCYDWGSAFPYG